MHALTTALDHKIFDAPMKYGSLVVQWAVGRWGQPFLSRAQCSKAEERILVSIRVSVMLSVTYLLFACLRSCIVEQFEYNPAMVDTGVRGGVC